MRSWFTMKDRLLAGTIIAGVAVAGLAGVAHAQTAPAETASAEEEIIVTGSILRGNAQSVSPVGVLSDEDMEARGQTTIADVVQTLSGNNAGQLPNSFSANGAFANGASGASLRGLLTSNTVVLVDGQRLASYPLADDALRNFVDLNTISQNIVERVETLKDGASSTYGADAIAGAINIITRREYEGAEIKADRGWAQDGGADQIHFSGIWGHGDLADDGFNVYLAAEYQKDDILYNRDRGFPFNTADLSSICTTSIVDGVTETCGFNGMVNGIQHDGSFLLVGAGINAVVRRADPAAPATMFGDYQLLNPDCGANTPVTITPAMAALGGIGGFSAPVDLCQQDLVRDYGVVAPENERLSFSGRMTFDLGAQAQFYLTGSYYQNKVFYTGTPSTIRAQTTPAASGVTVNTTNIALPVYVCPSGSINHVCDASDPGAVLNPQNPFAADGDVARIFYRFGDIDQNTSVFSQSFRAAGGVEGSWDAMDREFRYNVGVSAMQTDLEVVQNGRLFVPNLHAAVNQGAYNFVNPESNTEEIRNFISPQNVQNSVSKLIQAQAIVGTNLFELPGGPAEIGVGLAVRYESLDNPSANDDLNGPENRYFTINPFGATGSRDTEAAFFELSLPFTSMIDVTASGRYDYYSTGQSAFSPKAGVRFTPFDFVSFRGTYSEGFRIPSFAESFAVPSTGFITVNAGPECDAEHGGPGNPYCNGYGLGLTTISDPNLDPETSKNYNIGFVLRPFANWSFSADYYKIEIDDVIGVTPVPPAVDAYYAGDPIPPGFEIIQDVPDPNFPNAIRRIGFVRFGLQNVGTRSTNGWDFALAGSFDFGGIEWTTTGEATYLHSLKQQFPGGAEEEYAGTIGPFIATSASGAPQWRLNWQNTFIAGPAAFTVTAYWTEGYLTVAEDNAGDHNDETCLSGVHGGTPTAFLDGETPLGCKVDDSFYVDLHGSYDFTEKFQVYLDVANVFDEDPALDFTTYGANSYNPAWGTPGIIGRFITIGARARF